MVKCEICQREFKRITKLHVEVIHSVTLGDYKRRFPNAEMDGEEWRQSQRASHIGCASWNKGLTKDDDPRVGKQGHQGRPYTPEHCKHISEGKKGRHIKSYVKSDEHKRKISETLKGRHLSEEHRRNIGLAFKGVAPWNKGKRMSDEFKLLQSLIHKGKPHTPEHTRATMLAQNIRPNDAEQKMEALLNYCCPGQYKYTGDGTFILGGLCPDFINCNGQKKVIEVFGDYWHSERKTGRNQQAEEENKKSRYAVYGFSCLIIWEHELDIVVWNKETRITELSPLINKILEFEEGGG